MRSSPRIARQRPIALALLLTYLPACSSWRVETLPPAQVLATSHPSTVRVTKADRSTVVLNTPGVVRDTLWGWRRGAELGVPVTEVRAIATRHGDLGKSLLLGVGIVGTLAAVTAIGLANSKGLP